VRLLTFDVSDPQTLCMILNALGVDPQKQFKGPWRYYSQEMLECVTLISPYHASLD